MHGNITLSAIVFSCTLVALLMLFYDLLLKCYYYADSSPELFTVNRTGGDGTCGWMDR